MIKTLWSYCLLRLEEFIKSTSPVKWKWKWLSCVWLFVTPWTTVHGILQARILEWVAIPFSRGYSQPRDQTQVSHSAGGFFTIWATREAHLVGMGFDFIMIVPLLPSCCGFSFVFGCRVTFFGRFQHPPLMIVQWQVVILVRFYFSWVWCLPPGGWGQSHG